MTKEAAIQAYRKHAESLPALLGMEMDWVGDKAIQVSLKITHDHLNPAHNAVHAGSVVALADTASGWGCIAHLPVNAIGFTTIDLSCNLIGSVTSGRLICKAQMLHGGRTTQVWDAIISNEAGKRLAAFRCTELILYG
ncbi:MAG: PaaI family thioesterase [Proteobacteria bacterium]|nr:PaaI family thioesterase [Pseudomonadota bacterium]